MADFNIDVNASGPGKEKLDEFCNFLDLTNLVREATIDPILFKKLLQPKLA